MFSFFATFGMGHDYAGCYVHIRAESRHAATAFMVAAHGDRWSSPLYAADDFKGQISKFNLHRLALVEQRRSSFGSKPIFDVAKVRPNGRDWTEDDAQLRPRPLVDAANAAAAREAALLEEIALLRGGRST